MKTHFYRIFGWCMGDLTIFVTLGTSWVPTKTLIFFPTSKDFGKYKVDIKTHSEVICVFRPELHLKTKKNIQT